MLTECKSCQATVDAAVIGSYDALDQEFGNPVKFTLAKCPRCDAPLLLAQDDFGNGWDEPARLFPPRDDLVGWAIPDKIRKAYIEAVRCFNAKAFTASAIMCRKTIEGVCQQQGVSERTLKLALNELRSRGIIEGRLFEWADELRLAGNEAAHDVDVEFSTQDAGDAVEFTKALLEYVYTFREKFEQFKQRRQKRKTAPTTN